MEVNIIINCWKTVNKSRKFTIGKIEFHTSSHKIIFAIPGTFINFTNRETNFQKLSVAFLATHTPLLNIHNPHLFFQPELYKKDLVRQSSADSSGGPEMEYCGKLHFALRYDKDVEGLIVKVCVHSRDCFWPRARSLCK